MEREIVYFGKYPYEPDGEPVPIPWIVLEEYDDGSKFLLTKDLIDRISYHNVYESTVWADCSLRAWLNGEFLETAFTEDERARIAETELHTPDNPEADVPGGPDTVDRIFCITREDCANLFEDDADRAAKSTPLAVAHEGMINWWWLRSPGEYGLAPCAVFGTGLVYLCNGHYDERNISIRPALVLKPE